MQKNQVIVSKSYVTYVIVYYLSLGIPPFKISQRRCSLSSEVAEAATRKPQIGCVRASSKLSTDFWGA